MVTMGGDLWPGCLADRLLTGLGQPQIIHKRREKRKKSSVLLRILSSKVDLQATLSPNFQSMRTQAESTDIAHNMFGQIKMEIPWNNSRHTLISRKRGCKPRMISGQFVVVCVGVHQLSVSPNTSHPMLQICSNGYNGYNGG